LKNQYVLIIVAAAAIAAIAISLAYVDIQKNNSKAGSADDDSTTFEQEAGSEDTSPPFFEASLRINVCPDGSGSMGHPGTIVRGGSEIAISLCISSTNTSEQLWHLEARGLISENVDSGIHVRFENDSIKLAGVKGSDNFSLYPEIKDNTILFIGADNSAQPGIHGIMIVAVLPVGANETTSVVTQIYVDVKGS
jgi:hypothetical protein